MTQIDAPAAGLRQRKKQRTRQQLAEAGVRLFLAQGYERTTVDQIADAVEVSPRTFFRYFASKEDVVFEAMAAAEEVFYQALCARPPHERPGEALRAALGVLHDELCDQDSVVVNAGLHVRVTRLIAETPVLLARHLRRTEELEDRIAAELARREGVDVDLDPRPRLVTAAFGAAVRVADRAWSRAGDEVDVTTLVRSLQQHLDLLVPALTRDWAEFAPPAT